MLSTAGHHRRGGIPERGKGTGGRPGTWESHLALREMPEKVATGLPTTWPERERRPEQETVKAETQIERRKRSKTA